jgi:hypothetical protein
MLVWCQWIARRSDTEHVPCLLANKAIDDVKLLIALTVHTHLGGTFKSRMNLEQEYAWTSDQLRLHIGAGVMLLAVENLQYLPYGTFLRDLSKF